MKIISFAETTGALLAGRKTCTRREWASRHGRMFRGGDIIKAYNKSPRNGGKQVACIRLTQEAYPTGILADSDWEDEGFAYMTEQGQTLFGGKTPAEVWAEWRKPGGVDGLWVVRFQLMECCAKP